MGRPIPLNQLQSRLTEQGRIRLGVKSGRSMKALDTFRFTSPDESVIAMLAQLYGGTPRPWSDPKASPKNQHEVITEAAEVRVWLQSADSLTQDYELWTGKGRQRVCDGITAKIPQQLGPEDWGDAEVDCICAEQDRLECSIKTRMRVVLPDIPFGGAWRLETKGMNAAMELPPMSDMLAQLTTQGLVEGFLRLEQRQAQTPDGKRRHFVVPTLKIGATPEQIQSGGAAALQAAPEPVAELGAGEVVEVFEGAEVIELKPQVDAGVLGSIEHKLMLAADHIGRNRDELQKGVVLYCSGGRTEDVDQLYPSELERVREAADGLAGDTVMLRGFETDGTAILMRGTK